LDADMLTGTTPVLLSQPIEQAVPGETVIVDGLVPPQDGITGFGWQV